MRSPEDMGTIVIDITNACIHNCSNCTRFCGHHKKAYFMDFETFKQAVDSLSEYNGRVGIIGGEPTLHPDFESICHYISKKRGNKKSFNSNRPIFNYSKYDATRMVKSNNEKIGLLSSISKTYLKHYETINDTFNNQQLNDHKNACKHQALLISRDELGISDDEWLKLRDSCWIQNTWSASITPKGAFFCEVAGALDMLFDGPGGWEVTKDWWKRQPKDFTDQLHWCELCSACLDVPTRLSNDGRDDISPLMITRLNEIGSPKIKKGLYVPFDVSQYGSDTYHGFKGGNDYMEADGNKTLKIVENPWKIEDIICCEVDDISATIATKISSWILIVPNKKKRALISQKLSKYIFNPGAIYRYKGCILFNTTAHSISGSLTDVKSVEDLLSLYPIQKKINIYSLHWCKIRENLEYWYSRVLLFKRILCQKNGYSEIKSIIHQRLSKN